MTITRSPLAGSGRYPRSTVVVARSGATVDVVDRGTDVGRDSATSSEPAVSTRGRAVAGAASMAKVPAATSATPPPIQADLRRPGAAAHVRTGRRSGCSTTRY